MSEPSHPGTPQADDEAVDARVRAVLDDLSARGAPWRSMPCDPALADTAAFCAAYGFALADSANTILAVGKGDLPQYVACVLLATTRLDVNGTVRRRLGVRKASFASADATVAVSGMQIGGVTPFALPHTVPVWVDRAVVARPEIVLGGGSRRTKVVCPPATLLHLPGVEVVDGLAMPIVDGTPRHDRAAPPGRHRC